MNVLNILKRKKKLKMAKKNMSETKMTPAEILEMQIDKDIDIWKIDPRKQQQLQEHKTFLIKVFKHFPPEVTKIKFVSGHPWDRGSGHPMDTGSGNYPHVLIGDPPEQSGKPYLLLKMDDESHDHLHYKQALCINPWPIITEGYSNRREFILFDLAAEQLKAPHYKCPLKKIEEHGISETLKGFLLEHGVTPEPEPTKWEKFCSFLKNKFNINDFLEEAK